MIGEIRRACRLRYFHSEALRVSRAARADAGGAACSSPMPALGRQSFANGLLDRRERGRQQDLRLLLEDRAVARRGPEVVGGCLLAHGYALVEALVGPDVHPLIEPADVGSEDAGQRRELDAARQVFAPALG